MSDMTPAELDALEDRLRHLWNEPDDTIDALVTDAAGVIRSLRTELAERATADEYEEIAAHAGNLERERDAARAQIAEALAECDTTPPGRNDRIEAILSGSTTQGTDTEEGNR